MSFGPNPTFLAIAMSLALCLFVAVGPPYPTHSGNVGAVLGECSYGVARLPSRNPSCPRPSHAHTASYSCIFNNMLLITHTLILSQSVEGRDVVMRVCAHVPVRSCERRSLNQKEELERRQRSPHLQQGEV